ncbi:dynein regulatory complex protein 10 [Pseudophryne corroboree]|uniref:dynein regulatory complex protein 10 n=1 Tax=Pseudophryne corroboree TaxID=495146 RepID=UPI00308218A3
MASEVLPVAQSPMLSSPSQSPVGSIGRLLKPNHSKMMLNIDSLKMLEPGRKKLTSVETQRVVAVLDETIKKLQLVSLFQHAFENLDRYSIVFGTELMGALREHQRLQDSMQRQLRLMNKESDECEEEDGSKWTRKNLAETLDVNLTAFGEGVRSSVRNTLRLFLTNPTACEALTSESHVRDAAAQKLLQFLSELRGCLFEMLLTSPLEHNEKMCYLQEISLRDNKNREYLATLEEELNAAILDRDTEIGKKNETIRQLKISLHQLEKLSESQVKRITQEAENQQKADQRALEGKSAKLQHELQQLRSHLNGTISEHREVELSLRKKKYKVETEIENWIQKYDADMGEKQAELEELEALYEEEKAHLAELKEKLATVEVEYAQIEEERRQAQLRKEAEEKEHANKVQAATIIQAHWRGYQVRKTTKSKKKKKKGKGKGKKGKK